MAGKPVCISSDLQANRGHNLCGEQHSYECDIECAKVRDRIVWDIQAHENYYTETSLHSLIIGTPSEVFEG